MKKAGAKKEKWFFDGEAPYDISGTESGIKIKKKLYSGKSLFQKIEFLDTYAYGRVLVLDGIVQVSEKDEFIYHEMLCQVPIFLHKKPGKVLIIGGGDGGSLKEVLKHNIEKAWMVEIDKRVVEFSEKYFPSISKSAFKDKRAEIFAEDGKEFIKKYNNFFDVIILDLSDPAGPAEDLIALDFYRNIKRALKKDGVVSVQSGSFTYQPKLVSVISKRLKAVFPSIEKRRAVVPSYQAGEHCFIIGAKFGLKKISFKDIAKKYAKLKLNLKYYSPEIHFASKVLPKYLKEETE